jgi:hypothetical protein
MFGSNWLLVPSRKDGLCTHAIWKRKDLPSADRGAEYMNSIATNKSLLAKLCIDFACEQIKQGTCMFSTDIDIPSSDIKYLILYYEFADAFVNPARMHNPEADELKENIISAMTAFNEEIAASKQYPVFVGRPGFLAVSWNDTKKCFEFPSFKKLITGPTIILKEQVIGRI